MPQLIDAARIANEPTLRSTPNGDAVINLSIDYLRVATDLSADADISIIPSKWHTSVLIQGALAQGYEWDSDDRMKLAISKFKDGLEIMKSNYPVSTVRHRVMRSIDDQPQFSGPMPFPANYPTSWPR